MEQKEIEHLLIEAKELTNHNEYVIIGSLCIYGAITEPPHAMTLSNDLDLYPKNDPGRASEIADKLGYGTNFQSKYKYYADATSPKLATLPDGWESRLNRLDFDSGITAWCLEPHDAAISKYTRYEERDKRWIRAGLKAKILTIPTLEYRLRETVMEPDEMKKVKKALAKDKEYIRNLTSTGPK